VVVGRTVVVVVPTVELDPQAASRKPATPIAASDAAATQALTAGSVPDLSAGSATCA
jgi:hypothetical protein